MFFRELDFSLEEIKNIINHSSFGIVKSIEKQIALLNAKSARLTKITELAKNTLKNLKGEMPMQNKERFEAFKNKIIDDNEKQYGQEVVSKYGEGIYIKSKKKLKAMTQQEYKELEQLSLDINNAFLIAFPTKNPKSEEAQKAVELHKKWISFYWGRFDKDAYIGLAKNYVDDERFVAYYDKLSKGMAVFVRDSIIAYFE